MSMRSSALASALLVLACGDSTATSSTGDGTTTTSDGTSTGPGPSGTASATTEGLDESSTASTASTDASTDDTTAGEEMCPPPDPAPPGSWTSALVYPGADGYLVYETDDAGNRIPDFGAAGYRRGLAPIPDVPTAIEIAPVDGDDTAAIQAALDEAGRLPLDAEGHRGAVVLAPGLYTIAGILELRHSGVVLRGAGDGDDPATDTILQAIGDTPHQRDVLVVGGDDDRWEPEVPGTRTDVVSELVPVGALELEVADASAFAVGDHVVIVHPCTDAWLAAVDYGAPETDEPWTEGSQPLVFKRQIMAIDGARLTFDAPFFNHLDRSLSQSYVYLADRSNLVTEVGVEDLRIDIETAGGDDEDHAWSAIQLRGVEDAWVRRVTALHFGYAGVTVATGVQVTVEDVRALDPVAQITGGRMYNFDVSGAQQVLFTHCHARGGRHHFVSNGTSWTSGVVFHRSTSEGAHAPSEGHRRWSMGLLYDTITEVDANTAEPMGLYCRGDYGTSHGWASVHSVAWNYDLGDGGIGLIQRPPTAQNYAIGGNGTFSGETPPAPFERPEGYIEGTGMPGLFPESLYEQQLAERRCPPP